MPGIDRTGGIRYLGSKRVRGSTHVTENEGFRTKEDEEVEKWFEEDARR